MHAPLRAYALAPSCLTGSSLTSASCSVCRTRASPACRRACAASTGIASCAGARLSLEPRHASIRKHRVLIVSLCPMRRGLALIIESDFYATDAGRQHFADRKCHASNPTTSPLDSRGDCCVRRAHVHSVLRPGDVQYAPRFERTHTSHTPSRPLLTLLPALAKTLMCCTRTSRRPTTTSPVRHAPLQPSLLSQTHSPALAPGRRRPLQEPAPQAQHPHGDEPRCAPRFATSNHRFRRAHCTPGLSLAATFPALVRARPPIVDDGQKQERIGAGLSSA